MAILELPEVVKFEVTVDEFVQITSLPLSQTKAAKTRASMKKMIKELKGGNQRLVEEILAPLCKIGTSEELDRVFGGGDTRAFQDAVSWHSPSFFWI